MSDFIMVLVCLALGALVGFVYGGDAIQNHYREKAVEHGCASYDPQTGKWGWKP